MAFLLIVISSLLHSVRGELRLENGAGKTPPMGWNSWNHFGCNIDESVVKETAQALVSTGLAALGYNYVNVDDCWSELQRNENGKLVANDAAFPSGIKALADYVHELGLKFGIYSDAGFLTCEKRPGSLGHEYEDAQTFAAWGVDYLKYDNCFNDGRKPEPRYAAMRDALNSTGRSVFFSMCEWGIDDPAKWASRIGNSWRTTGDIKDFWLSMTRIADLNDRWASFAGPGGWNDPDMLEVGNGGMSFEEYRSHFSIWALMKAPLLLGCDIRNLAKETMEIISNEEVISINQDPLGVQGRKVSSKGFFKCQEIWAGPLSSGRTAVVIWNRCLFRSKIELLWQELSIPPSTVVCVRDVWKHIDLGCDFSRHLEVRVAAHGVEMFIVVPAAKSSFI